MTPEELDVIEQRVDATSEAPWEAKAYRVYVGDRSMGERIVAACWRPWGPVTGDGSIEADAAFIAHARQDVPALIAALRASQAQVARLEAELEQTHERIYEATNGS